MNTDNRTNEPTEAQVEAAAKAYQAAQNADPYDFKGRMRAALVAAQGAARPVNSFDTTAERVKTGAESSHVLDPDKVAEMIEQMRDRACKERDVTKESLGQFIARALCEAYKEGKLT